jgi:hypothetical protein
MKVNRKYINADKFAVSAVIGVILMVAVAIAMAAVSYAYFTGMIGNNTKDTPLITVLAEQIDHNATLTVQDVSESSIPWSDVWFTFVDIYNQTQWQNVPSSGGWNIVVNIPRSGVVGAGQIISIKSTFSGSFTAATPLVRSHNYQLTLIYNQSGGTMGVTEWTQ